MTRQAFVLLLCAMEFGCSDTAGPDLAMNVRVHTEGLFLYARELGSDCTCTAGEWPEPGECVSSSDGVSCTCEPAPASCLDRFRIERAGAVLADGPYDSDLGGGEPLSADLATSPTELVVTGCGGQARIPLPAVADLPQPTIEQVTDDGQALTIAWSSTPAAASALVTGGDGFVSRVCHDLTGAVDLPSVRAELAEEARVSVHAFTAPESVDTPLGEARIWAGGRTAEAIPLPPR
jgi:hypothetical protein